MAAERAVRPARQEGVTGVVVALGGGEGEARRDDALDGGVVRQVEEEGDALERAVLLESCLKKRAVSMFTPIAAKTIAKDS